jgi:DNA processing protein
VSVVSDRDTAYPANLLPFDDAPPLLFVRGALLPDDKFSIAIVGSRRATGYGHRQAERFARAFAERGLTVVSGGAAGIDSAAHKGALWSGGRTVAVLGCGVDVTYPADNRRLFEEIVERGGAIISEFALGTTPEPWRFPTRNRIIAGMSRATILVETPSNSGALITARDAAQMGRDVWVVPGPVDTGRSQGGHQLIQDGAALADSPGDVLAALGLAPVEPAPVPIVSSASGTAPPPAVAAAALPVEPPQPVPAAVSGDLSTDEARLLAQFDLAPRHLDEASAAAGLAASQATVAATLLEMKALIRRLPGNLYARVL